MAKYLGIDPGLTGGIALLTESSPADTGSSLNLWVMPTTRWTKDRRMVDDVELSNILRSNGPIDHAFIELVHAMPKQGACSMFSFGAGWGMVRGICAGLQIPYSLVTPQQWQKVMLAGHPKGSEKTVASGYWPAECFIARGCRKIHDGLLDAALIAEYGRRLIHHA